MSKTFSRRPGYAAMDGRRASGHCYSGPFFISWHAAERFRERVAPGLTVTHARAEAVALARSARKTDMKSPRGDDIWIATDGAPVRFIVRKDPRVGLICATVLGADDRDDASQPILDAAAE